MRARNRGSSSRSSTLSRRSRRTLRAGIPLLSLFAFGPRITLRALLAFLTRRTSRANRTHCSGRSTRSSGTSITRRSLLTTKAAFTRRALLTRRTGQTRCTLRADLTRFSIFTRRTSRASRTSVAFLSRRTLGARWSTVTIVALRPVLTRRPRRTGWTAFALRAWNTRTASSATNLRRIWRHIGLSNEIDLGALSKGNVLDKLVAWRLDNDGVGPGSGGRDPFTRSHNLNPDSPICITRHCDISEKNTRSLNNRDGPGYIRDNSHDALSILASGNLGG